MKKMLTVAIFLCISISLGASDIIRSTLNQKVAEESNATMVLKDFYFLGLVTSSDSSLFYVYGVFTIETAIGIHKEGGWASFKASIAHLTPAKDSSHYKAGFQQKYSFLAIVNSKKELTRFIYFPDGEGEYRKKREIAISDTKDINLDGTWVSDRNVKIQIEGDKAISQDASYHLTVVNMNGNYSLILKKDGYISFDIVWVISDDKTMFTPAGTVWRKQ